MSHYANQNNAGAKENKRIKEERGEKREAYDGNRIY